MLTKATIRNFNRFGEAEIETGNPVVFFGPNNSGNRGSARWSTRSEHNADHYRVLTRVFCDKDRIAGSHPER